MPCRVSGCENTWTWFGWQQIRSLGKPPPKRMCDDHLAEFEGIADKEIPCRNPWCTNTWTWNRFAQLRQLEHEGKSKPPHRLCDSCFAEERATEDMQVPCKIPECRNTWTWPRQAQLKHRGWVRRQLARIEAEERGETLPPQPSDAALHSEGEAGEHAEGSVAQADAGEHEHAEHEHAEHEHEHAEHEHAEHEHDEHAEHEDEAGEVSEARPDEGGKPAKKGRRKRKRRRSKIHEGPPERLCERCSQRIAHVEPLEVPCKVHGCHNTWTWDREGQLRAWATLDHQQHVTELPQPPRRMCPTCVDFVRRHPDREVDCGRPGCEKTWTYKTGAQLQDYLAGRTQDPIRLCEECIRSQFTISTSDDAAVPPGSEVMPCQVAGCTGSWVWVPGMKLSATDPDATEPPLDRMCDDCRTQRGAEPRDPRRVGGGSDEPDVSMAAVAEGSVETDDFATSPDDALTEPVTESDTPEE